jgi:predicted flap endonuclease-1-like 5' DNA nuclease
MPTRAIVAVTAVSAVAASVAAVAWAGPRRVGRLIRRARGSDRAAQSSLTATAANEATAAGAADDVPAGADDLKVIEGIGPRIAGVLYDAGITTYGQLATSTPKRLESIMKASGRKLADPTTWPEQAKLAADGDWAALEILQASLKKGRRATR